MISGKLMILSAFHRRMKNRHKRSKRNNQSKKPRCWKM